jgi:hypothetical protein
LSLPFEMLRTQRMLSAATPRATIGAILSDERGRLRSFRRSEAWLSTIASLAYLVISTMRR